MKESIKNILFDLDGTITDPKFGIVNSIHFALEKLNIIEAHIDELDSFIGPPLRESFISRYNLSNEITDNAITYYREYFSEKGLYENSIYNGVIELLEFLSINNYHLFVATSKPTVYASEILKHFKLDKYFIEIVGSNLDNTRTEKTDVISYTIMSHGLQTYNSVIIGDRKHDIIGARNNSMKSIAVTYVYGTLEEIIESEPNYIVSSCDGLKWLLSY